MINERFRDIGSRLPEHLNLNPLFLLPYEARKKKLVLPEHESYERIPALATNFIRIDGPTISRLRARIGKEYVDGMEHVIVDERCRVLGTAIKWASQLGLTA